MPLVSPDLADLESAPPDVASVLPRAPHVFAPATADGVAEVLTAASSERAAVVPWGGGTHQGLGHPVEPDVVLALSRLDRIVEWVPDDLTVVVEAGVRVDDLESHLAERAQTAALPEMAPGATVGGVIAAGVSGYRRPRYGPTRDRILQVTVATGDGRLVTAGSRVVKNVSGYDIQRSVAGTHGALGVIISVCFKLWPRSQARATVRVDDATAAWTTLHRPLAVLETDQGAAAYLEGPAALIDHDAGILGSDPEDGHDWPAIPDGPVTAAVTVPPSDIAAAVDRVSGIGPFVAQHGVGRVDLAGPEDVDWEALRSWAQAKGGRLTITRATTAVEDRLDPWGAVPSGVAVQRRLVAAFDPARVINPGRLPGPL